MTNAEKQKRYRERAKWKTQAIGVSNVTPTDLRRAFVNQKFLNSLLILIMISLLIFLSSCLLMRFFLNEEVILCL